MDKNELVLKIEKMIKKEKRDKVIGKNFNNDYTLALTLVLDDLKELEPTKCYITYDGKKQAPPYNKIVTPRCSECGGDMNFVKDYCTYCGGKIIK